MVQRKPLSLVVKVLSRNGKRQAALVHMFLCGLMQLVLTVLHRGTQFDKDCSIPLLLRCFVYYMLIIEFYLCCGEFRGKRRSFK